MIKKHLELEENNVAYAMQKAYINNSNRENAVIEVYNKFHTNTDVLKAMWDAIDAYVDINEDFIND